MEWRKKVGGGGDQIERQKRREKSDREKEKIDMCVKWFDANTTQTPKRKRNEMDSIQDKTGTGRDETRRDETGYGAALVVVQNDREVNKQ